MKSLLKVLIFLKIFLSSIAVAEPIVPDPEGVVDNIVVTLTTFETLEEMRDYLSAEYPNDDWSDTMGLSLCWRDVKKNIAICDIYIPEPQEVDGEHTTTLGHEVLHGRYGVEYHK